MRRKRVHRYRYRHPSMADMYNRRGHVRVDLDDANQHEDSCRPPRTVHLFEVDGHCTCRWRIPHAHDHALVLSCSRHCGAVQDEVSLGGISARSTSPTPSPFLPLPSPFSVTLHTQLRFGASADPARLHTASPAPLVERGARWGGVEWGAGAREADRYRTNLAELSFQALYLSRSRS